MEPSDDGAKILDFCERQARQEQHQQPWPTLEQETSATLSGDAICLQCRHEWQATTPAGVANFECPQCHTYHGIWAGPIEPEEDLFVCQCGSELWFITVAGIQCRCCGIFAVFE